MAPSPRKKAPLRNLTTWQSPAEFVKKDFAVLLGQWSVVSGQWSGFRVQGSGFRFQVSGFRFRVSGFGFQVSGFRFRVSGFGFQGGPSTLLRAGDGVLRGLDS